MCEDAGLTDDFILKCLVSDIKKKPKKRYLELKAYALLKRLANTAEAGGLAQPRAVLLLWFLRNVVGIDDLDAYEYVCDSPLDEGIDGLEPAKRLVVERKLIRTRRHRSSTEGPHGTRNRGTTG